jgi:hypothetical protein
MAIHNIWVFLENENVFTDRPILGTAYKRYQACRLYNQLVKVGSKPTIYRGRPDGKSIYERIDPKELEDEYNKITLEKN